MHKALPAFRRDEDTSADAYFSLMLPDRQPLAAGTYEISITINGRALANETIIVR